LYSGIEKKYDHALKGWP